MILPVFPLLVSLGDSLQSSLLKTLLATFSWRLSLGDVLLKTLLETFSGLNKTSSSAVHRHPIQARLLENE